MVRNRERSFYLVLIRFPLQFFASATVKEKRICWMGLGSEVPYLKEAENKLHKKPSLHKHYCTLKFMLNGYGALDKLHLSSVSNLFWNIILSKNYLPPPSF